MPKVKPIELDGSTLEGGGQLVRVALALSAITGLPLHIYNIRANRAPQGRSKHISKGQSRGGSGKVEGGLKESHLAALVYLARQCNAYVEGAEIGSRQVTFIPMPVLPSVRDVQTVVEDTSTDFESNAIELRKPGSVWLILQAILPFLIFGESTGMSATRNEQHTNEASASQETKDDDVITLKLKGGTNVSQSMSGEYAQHVLFPTLRRVGLPVIECEILERGWAGNAPRIGEVHITFARPPAGRFRLPSFEMNDPGDVERITLHIIAGDEDSRIKLEQGLRAVIAEHFGLALPVDLLQAEDSGDPRRLYVLLVGYTTNGWRLGRDLLGSGRTPKNDAEREKMVGQICQTLVRDLRSEVKRGGCLDEFLQDQLVIFQALTSGVSTVDGGHWNNHKGKSEQECGDEEGSLHTRTVRWVCEKMLQKQGVEFTTGGKCQGIGCNLSLDDAAVDQLEALSIY